MTSTTKRSSTTWMFALVILVGAALYLVAGGLPGETSENRTTPIPVGSSQYSELDPIDVRELPPEAQTTLDLIGSGGPYPFSRDDTVFQNREGLLPDQPRGYYREYTVITPGEDDRGARRIVAGDGGDLYYTADHYQSFHEIVRAGL